MWNKSRGWAWHEQRFNPTARAPRAGEWRVGAKAAYELFPGGLKSRLQVRWFVWDVDVLLPRMLWLLSETGVASV